ncbi:MAG: hypothetical protein QOF59_75, partial [Actinomycetota bacterium]|nr:hypothetical protein [Actinomycetota bacterium]
MLCTTGNASTNRGATVDDADAPSAGTVDAVGFGVERERVVGVPGCAGSFDGPDTERPGPVPGSTAAFDPFGFELGATDAPAVGVVEAVSVGTRTRVV